MQNTISPKLFINHLTNQIDFDCSRYRLVDSFVGMIVETDANNNANRNTSCQDLLLDFLEKIRILGWAGGLLSTWKTCCVYVGVPSWVNKLGMSDMEQVVSSASAAKNVSCLVNT